MDSPIRVHHLTWVVADLEAALATLAPLVGDVGVVREGLPGRGVLTARLNLGNAWLVLVQPTAPGTPATRLQTSGEGLLLLSIGVPALDEALAVLAQRGVGSVDPPRSGVAGWRVADLELSLPGGVTIQLCEEPGQSLPS